MNVVFVTPYYPPYDVGGGERSAFALASALAHRGHDVSVVAPRLGDTPPQTDVPVTLVDVGLTAAVGGRALPSSVFDSIRVQWRLGRAVHRMARTADLVHCQAVHVLPAAYAGARSAGTPIVATLRDLGAVCPLSVCLLHSDRVPSDCGVVKLERQCVPQFRTVYGGRSRVRMSLAAFVRFGTARARALMLRRCDAVYSVGSDLGRLYADAGLLDPARIAVLGNVVGPEPRSRRQFDGGYALYAGKVSVGKGMAELLQAVDLVRQDAPEFRLQVAGYADEAWSAELARHDGVEYLGRLPREALLELYRGARLAAVPSISPEAFGRAAAEASLCGVPVVATRIGGLPEVVLDGVTGLLVSPRDPHALAAAILSLWHDDSLCRRLGDAGRGRVRELFSDAAIARRAEELYGAILTSEWTASTAPV